MPVVGSGWQEASDQSDSGGRSKCHGWGRRGCKQRRRWAGSGGAGGEAGGSGAVGRGVVREMSGSDAPREREREKLIFQWVPPPNSPNITP